MKGFTIAIAYFLTNTIYAQITKQANWQQNVSYNIQVALDDEKHFLNGHIEITYTNNSPSELEEIWFHLWPNAYKNNNTAFAKQQLENNSTEFYFAKARNRGYIDSLNFKIDGQTSHLTFHEKWIDVAKISLPKNLKPGETIKITTPFRVKIPGSFSRMGHVGNSYQITQWFPKPAVYDVNGWNYFPYLDQGEFYSEFGKFDVSITLPQNYVVAATGELQDTTEQTWLKDRVLYYKGRDDREEQTASSALLKTIRFVQDSIHDFAWFADKDFYVFESEIMLKDSSKKIKTYFYTNSSYHSDAVKGINQAVYFYSEKVGNYPYSSASGVVGPLKAGGGMEYPMITVLANADRATIVHEVGHNWFYGILGTNERRYPWMDESINSYYEDRESRNVDTKSKRNYSSKFSTKQKFGNGLGLVYAHSLTTNTDQAINLTSTDYTSSNYGGIIYGKGAFSFGLLQSYLGDSMFDAAMQYYYQQWKFKHPLPTDLKNSLEATTGKDLSWFFDDIIGSTKTYDYKIVRLKYKKYKNESFDADSNNYRVLVKNTGRTPAPLQVALLNKGEKEKELWHQGFVGKQWIDLPGTERLRSLTDTNLASKEARRVNKRMNEVTEVVLNIDNPLPELNIHNNRIKTNGVFKKTEKLAISGANHRDRRTTPSIVPLVNYNYYDNWMYGAALSNLAHWERRFHYYAVGMYSNSLAPIKYEVFARQMFRLNSKSINRLDIYGKVSSFGHNPNFLVLPNQLRSTYTRINGGASLYFKNIKKPYRKSFRKLDLNYNILRDAIASNSAEAAFFTNAAYSNIITLQYEFKSNKKLNPLNYKVVIEQINAPQSAFTSKVNAQKIYGEINKVFHFSKMASYLSVRGFAGFIIGNSNSIYDYRASGNNGQTDYKYEQNLLARNEALTRQNNNNYSLGSRVLLNQFGALRVPVVVAGTGNLQAINLEYNFKRKLPFNLYFDAAYMSKPNLSSNFNYVGGVNFVIAKNYLEISLPLVYSQNITDALEINALKQSKSNSVNYNPFKNWHRLLVFKLNINYNQDDIINAAGL